MVIKVGGLGPSCNGVGAQLFAMDSEVGEKFDINILQGPAAWTDELKKANPFCQIPTLIDGDFGLGESNAIMRYIAQAGKVTKAYPGAADPKLSGKIDMAMDRFSGNVYKKFVETAYPIFGFGAPPADPAKAGAETVAEIQKYCDVVYPVAGKFTAGSDTPTIADYRAVPFFLVWSLPCVQQKMGVTMPQRMVDLVNDFKPLSKNWSIMTAAGGMSVVEFIESKCKGA